jgi:hypothetical protein
MLPSDAALAVPLIEAEKAATHFPIVITQRETLIEWRLEYLSLATDPPQPMVAD